MKRRARSKLTAPADHSEITRLFVQYRREIRAFCYRMTGSLHEADDCAQDTFARALVAAERFDGRAPRAWLYRIATNACLDLLRKRARRTLPHDLGPPSDPYAAFAPPLTESSWLEPVPDAWIDYTSSETIALAFVAVLQRLTPRARAVFVLRDALDLSTTETATALDISEAAVNGMLYRARSSLRGVTQAEHELADADRELLGKFVRAWRDGDPDAIVALMRTDAAVTMPPISNWFRGRADIAAALRGRLFVGGATFELVSSRANGMPAFGMYVQKRYWGLGVVRIDRNAIAELTLFTHPSLRSRFGLPLHYKMTVAQPR